jgi:SAM-dependent methyltransferase
MTSPFDAVAPYFDRHRTMPDGVAEKVRAAILSALASDQADAAGTSLRLLDLGVGSGRIGSPFVAAGDDYIGLDLSYPMLQAFRRLRDTRFRAVLVQADGCALPFGNAIFDAVLLMQVFGGLHRWRRLLDEAQRVLRPDGAIILGRTVTPADGVDAQMKQHLGILLGELATRPEQQNTREHAEKYLAEIASNRTLFVAASWSAERSPRNYLDRHARGTQFSQLPRSAGQASLRELGVWARTQFGTLDATFPETHRFEMHVFRFAGGQPACGTPTIPC